MAGAGAAAKGGRGGGKNAKPTGRLGRAKEQRMFLVSVRNELSNAADPHAAFVMIGASGNVYTVMLGSKVPDSQRCNCMDSKLRKRVCKHQLFVLLKVLRMSQARLQAIDDASRPIQHTEIEDALQKRAEKLMPGKNARFLAPSSVTQVINYISGGPAGSSSAAPAVELTEVEQRPIEADEACAICCEDLIATEENGAEDRPLTFCRYGCGKSIHQECFEQWRAANRSEVLTCVYCRSAWEPPRPASPKHQSRLTPIINVQGFLPVADAPQRGPSSSAAANRTTGGRAKNDAPKPTPKKEPRSSAGKPAASASQKRPAPVASGSETGNQRVTRSRAKQT